MDWEASSSQRCQDRDEGTVPAMWHSHNLAPCLALSRCPAFVHSLLPAPAPVTATRCPREAFTHSLGLCLPLGARATPKIPSSMPH